MDDGMGCELALRARNGFASIAQCTGCGCVHLALEHVTLRLAPEAFGELAGLVALAHRRMAGRADGDASAAAAAATLTH